MAFSGSLHVAVDLFHRLALRLRNVFPRECGEECQERRKHEEGVLAQSVLESFDNTFKVAAMDER